MAYQLVVLWFLPSSLVVFRRALQQTTTIIPNQQSGTIPPSILTFVTGCNCKKKHDRDKDISSYMTKNAFSYVNVQFCSNANVSILSRKSFFNVKRNLGLLKQKNAN